MYPHFKAQLNDPHANRRISFSEAGWEALRSHKVALEKRLEREISDSVCLDILLTKNDNRYLVVS